MFIDIFTKRDLLKKEDEISDLFKACYNKNLYSEEWRWFYIDNPIGPSFVSLFYEQQRLLGHYAVLPTLLNIYGKPFIAYRSMTTMVHPSARGRGLFVNLANRIYQILSDQRASLVYGFPNQNSVYAFDKYLKWKLPISDKIVDLKGKVILETPNLVSNLLQRSDIEWNVENKLQYFWRVSRPDTEFTLHPGLILKNYNGIPNILFLEERGLSYIQDEITYRLLLPGHFYTDKFFKNLVIDYQFGFRPIDQKYASKQFHPQLIMSDVF